MNQFLGHQPIVKYFDQAWKMGKLNHAYLFVGATGVGKKRMVNYLASKILAVEENKLASHPDWLVLSPEIDEKTGKTKKDISIEQVRNCEKFIYQFSFLGGYKIVLIDPAEKMSLSASNALLKTLEEPKQKTIIFLLVADERRVPMTIRSRCQTIYFSPWPLSQIRTLLETQGVEKSEVEKMALLSCGLPGKVEEWLDDNDAYQNYQKEIKRFTTLYNRPFYDKLKQVEDLFGDKTDHIAAREKLTAVLGVWQLALRTMVMTADNQLLKTNSIAIYEAIEIARRRLAENIHPRILVEEILLAMP